MSIRVESNAPADLDLENIHALDQLSQQLNASYAALEDEVSDLTQELERVRAARSKELIERERLALRLSALIDSLPGGVLVLDPDHTVILANPQAVELLSAPLLNQNFLRVIEQKAKDISADGKQLNLTSGRLIALSNEVSDHYGDQVVLLTDITDAQQKYQENRRAQKLSAMGETIARLAHQIRTPLSAALLYLGQLKTPILTDARQRASLEKAAQRLKHMEQVINQSLNFVQDHAPAAQDFSLFELLDALRTSVLPIIEQQKGAFSLDMPTQDILINGDQESLLSALVSVAENALDIAMPASLQVTARITPEGLEIVMIDQGPGFDEAIIGQVFDAFFTTRSDGTGLGLALAATIASNHDGQMRAENLPQGGACVTLSLPNTRLTWQQNTQRMQTIECYTGVAV